MVTLDALQELVEVVSEAGQTQVRRFVNVGFAVRQEAKKKRRVDTLGTRISAIVARTLGLEEDTVSDSLARILATSRDGAHIFLYEAFEPFIPPSRFRAGVTKEVESAATKGRPEFDSSLRFVRDEGFRARLERRFLPIATRAEKRKR